MGRPANARDDDRPQAGGYKARCAVGPGSDISGTRRSQFAILRAARTECAALPTFIRSLPENEVCDWQIMRVSDFEIKVVVEDESDFVAESLHC